MSTDPLGYRKTTPAEIENTIKPGAWRVPRPLGIACELCDRDPAQGESSIRDDDGVAHRVCHPLTDEGPRPLSCLEILGFVLVENKPNGRRPPQPIPDDLQDRARLFLARFGPKRPS